MRMMAILIGAALTGATVRAEKLSSVDREALLENLERMREAANAKVDGRFRLAMATYREAMTNDESALKFYLDCIFKVNFEAQQRKTSDFLEWKHQEDAKLSDPGFRAALRVQLGWLMLTLQASSEKTNLNSLVSEAQAMLDSIFSNAYKYAGQEQTLSQPVTTTIFAKRFEIGSIENKQWPLAPTHLDGFYNLWVFPPLRHPDKLDALRAAWIKRIHQEGIKTDAWAAHPRANPNGKPKNGSRKLNPPQEANGQSTEKFATETRPDLEWRMEMDLFRSGDEKAAAMQMLAHLTKYPNHKSLRNWSEELKNLLAPKVDATTPGATGATPE